MSRSLCYSLLLSGTFLIGPTYAQTGPGGVGNSSNNVLWLSGDHGAYNDAGTIPATNTQNVSQWNDRSGNGRHAGQATAGNRPNLHTNVLNGYPVLRYTAANNDRMMSTGLSSGNRASVWVVARHSSLPSSNPGLLQGADEGNAYSGTPGNKNIGMWVSSATTQVWGRGIQADGTTRNVTMATALATGVPYVINTMYTPASIDQYVNHGTAGSVTANGTLRSWTDLAIGCQGGTESWNGDIAEVIIYNEEVNDAQRIIIANYLAAKYGISLSANDVYQEDQPARGNFDHDVAGIGRINGANQNTDAQGSGILRISNPTHLDNDEFLMWGHDGGEPGAWGVGDLPSGVEGRLARIWRISERNTTGTTPVDVGAVDLTFDLSGLGYVDPEHLRLLVVADPDEQFADQVPIEGAEHVGGSLYRFPGVTALVDGAQFTIGTSNMSIAPLPIELVSFTAQAGPDGTVHLHWATASEWDNDHFEVERSADLQSWTTVAHVDAVGHSNALVEYGAVDAFPLIGTNYYRLKQIDLDGTHTTSHVVVVEWAGPQQSGPRVYPNPAREGVFIQCLEPLPEGLAIQVVDPAGRVMYQRRMSVCDGQGQWIELPGLAEGSYTMLMHDGTKRFAERILLVP